MSATLLIDKKKVGHAPLPISVPGNDFSTNQMQDQNQSDLANANFSRACMSRMHGLSVALEL